MANPSKWKLRTIAAGMIVMLGGLAALGSGCSSDDAAVAECESTRQYFAVNVWQVVASKCFACHNVQGIAKDTSYVLKGGSEPGFLEHNLKVIREVASFEQDGQSQWLLKPTLSIHHDGGAVVDKESDEYKAMLGLVVRLKNDEVCEEKQGGAFTGVEVAGPEVTLRKATLILGSRLPSAEEIQRVKEGGWAAVEQILDEVMTEPAFLDWVKRTYGDAFQTDLYLETDITDFLDDGPYANPFWYMGAEGKTMMDKLDLVSEGELQSFVQMALAREPLELISYVVQNDRSFKEIINADYSVFSQLSAKTYGAEMIDEFEGNSPWEFVAGRYPKYTNAQGDEADFPHAGVLTTPAFLSRWPTTATNTNRARSRVFMLFFLGLDILKTAEQPVDQSSITAINPQRDDPNCSVCHTVVDPIAGCFQAFHVFEDANAQTVIWQTDPEWYQEMWPPGFGEHNLPVSQANYGLSWLANLAAEDDRFALGAVYNAYRGLTGREALVAPDDFDDPNYEAMFQSFLNQADVFRQVADKFKAGDHNFKVIVKELVLSPYFRGLNSVKLSEQQLVALGEVGLGHLLTPVQLHHKLKSVLGIQWGGTQNPNLTHEPRDVSDTGQFQLFYGGVDFVDVNNRIVEPNGIMAAVAERMAIQMACTAVGQDFYRSPEDRHLFPTLEIDGSTYDPKNLEPESGGLAVPQAEVGIKETIVYLHEHILGEKLAVGDEEVQRTYDLFLETWREGKDKMAVDELSSNLPGPCQITQDPLTGEDLPEEEQVADDSSYTGRAWMAVLTYLLSDYQFLYE